MQKCLLKSCALLLSMGLLSSCDQADERFRGFVDVVVDNQEVVYLFDPKSIKEVDSGSWKYFMTIKKQLDGYILQEAKTDCSKKFATEDGTFFPYDDNKSQQLFKGYSLPNFQKDAHISAMISEVCKDKPVSANDSKAKDTDVTKSAPDQSMDAVTIEHHSGEGFLTKEVSALYAIHPDSDGVVFLKKGLEITVTGISSDKKYYRVKCKSIQDPLFVSTDSVALLGG